MRTNPSRRGFLSVISAVGAAVGLPGKQASARGGEPLAILGGTPVRKGRFSPWPIIADNDERAWMDVLRSANGAGSTATT